MSNGFYSSAEIRWFLSGQSDVGEQALYWFQNGDELPLWKEGDYNPAEVDEPFIKQEKARTDEYLLLPDSDTVGVKQRQGKLEVKALVAGPRPYPIKNHGVTGRMDQWIKWSFSSQNKEQMAEELSQAGPWRKVVKNRCLQEYSFDSGQIKPVSPDARPDTGCNIELTHLEVRVESNVIDALTFGFEAFGPSGQAVAILDIAVEHFFTARGSTPVQLDGHSSFSYPTWLATMI